LKLGQITGLSVAEISSIYMALILLLVVATVVFRVVVPTARSTSVMPSLLNYMSENRAYLSGSAVIAVALAIYYLYAGVYLEIPSDVFQHMEYVQTIVRQLEASANYGSSLPGFYLQYNGKYWHYFYALTNHWLGTDVSRSILAASYLNNLFFLLGVFSFAIIVFGKMMTNKRNLVLVSLAVCGFTFLHFGVNVFSFIRYYAMAPVMLNMVLYFAILGIAIRFFRNDDWPWREMLAACFIAYACLHIHMQEVLFAAVMVLLMSGYLFAGSVLQSLVSMLKKGEQATGSVSSLLRSKSTLVFIPLALAVGLFHIYSLLNIERNPAESPKLISLGSYLPYADNLFILNPTYQFYYVVGIWGLAVIGLFILNWKAFRCNAYIMAGMLSPLFTVFNPVFVDLFLRHSYSIMLWRLSFLVPVYLAGGYLLFIAVKSIRQANTYQRVAGVATTAVLILLALPYSAAVVGSPDKRYATLKPVDPNVSNRQWADLLAFLDTIKDRKVIITDPVTGYMVTAMTRHASPRYKFHRAWGGYVNFHFEEYSNHPFDRYAGRLLIINRRNGAMSETGRLARHWPENILQVSNYYQTDLLLYIESQPERFKLLWEQDRIRIYDIKRPGKAE
jgi:hypothetical protein